MYVDRYNYNRISKYERLIIQGSFPTAIVHLYKLNQVHAYGGLYLWSGSGIITYHS